MNRQYPFSAGAWERSTGWVSLVMLAVSLAWGLVLSPVDTYQGEVQRVLYVHVPSAWASFAAFFVIFVASIKYLRTREQRFDTIAHAAAGVGIVFCGLMLATGSVWGKFAWGVWWTWDARLTTAAVLFLIYAAYLLLRSFLEDEGQRGRYAAVIGIIGFLDVPIIHMSVYWWRTLHQPASVMRPDGPKMANEILFPLLFSSVTFLVFMTYLIIRRRRMLDAEREVERFQQSKLQESGV